MDSRMFGYTKQDVILFFYDWPFLSPTPYGSLTSHVIRDHLYCRVLNSFVLLIHKGASWCSFAESVLWWWKNLTSALYVFVILSVPFSTFRWTSSWISQLSFLCCLWRPMNIRYHFLRIIGYSTYQDSIEDSYQLTADGNHGLLFL